MFTFMTVSRQILLRMRNVLDKICRENQNAHFIFNNFFFFFLNCAVYEIMSKNVMEPEGPQMTSQLWRTCIACWIKARLQACTRMLMQPGTCIHACALRTHTHTHTQICNIYWVFHGNNDSRMHLSVTLYVHCLP
jgi:hypothetical protein